MVRMDEKGVFLISELNRITDVDFDATIMGSDVPVLVFFTAVWCGPCKMVLPGLQELKDEYQGRMLFCAIDIDESPKTPAKFGIRSIPTVFIFKSGPGTEILDKQIGQAPKSTFADLIDRCVS